MDSNDPPQTVMNAAAPQPTFDDATNPFIGRFGLRAVWGIALAILLFILLHFVLQAGRHAYRHMHGTTQSAQAAPVNQPSGDMQPVPGIVGEGSVFLGLLVILWILSRIEHRRVGVYGIGRNRLRDFLPGAFWGLACLSALVGVLHATHVLVFDGRALSGPAIYIFGAKWLLLFLCVGLLEESATRGYLQYTLTRGFFTQAEKLSPRHARAVAFWTAAVIMSFLFGAGHLGNPGETAPGIAAVFLAGMVFSYALWYTGSLWWAIGFHMAWDWAQSFLYGVPDSGFLSAGRLFNTHPTGNPLLSGGKTGPEASIFVLPTLLLVIVIVRFTTRPGVQPALEPLTPIHSLPPEHDHVIA